MPACWVESCGVLKTWPQCQTVIRWNGSDTGLTRWEQPGLTSVHCHLNTFSSLEASNNLYFFTVVSPAQFLQSCISGIPRNNFHNVLQMMAVTTLTLTHTPQCCTIKYSWNSVRYDVWKAERYNLEHNLCSNSQGHQRSRLADKND